MYTHLCVFGLLKSNKISIHHPLKDVLWSCDVKKLQLLFQFLVLSTQLLPDDTFWLSQGRWMMFSNLPLFHSGIVGKKRLILFFYCIRVALFIRRRNYRASAAVLEINLMWICSLEQITLKVAECVGVYFIIKNKSLQTYHYTLTHLTLYLLE